MRLWDLAGLWEVRVGVVAELQEARKTTGTTVSQQIDIDTMWDSNTGTLKSKMWERQNTDNDKQALNLPQEAQAHVSLLI